LIGPDPVSFTILHDHLNGIKTRNIVNPHIGPKPNPNSPSIIPSIPYLFHESDIIKGEFFLKNAVPKLDAQMIFIDDYLKGTERCKGEQNESHYKKDK